MPLLCLIASRGRMPGCPVTMLSLPSPAASSVTRPHGASELRSAPCADSVCWSAPAAELSRICSLVGMPPPDFSFLRTPQVRACRSSDGAPAHRAGGPLPARSSRCGPSLRCERHRRGFLHGCLCLWSQGPGRGGGGPRHRPHPWSRGPGLKEQFAGVLVSETHHSEDPTECCLLVLHPHLSC